MLRSLLHKLERNLMQSLEPGSGLLVLFDDELTTFRNKNDKFIFNVKKTFMVVKKVLRKAF